MMKFYSLLLGGSRFVSVTTTRIAQFPLPKNFSARTERNINALSQNLFAEFATKKYNISLTDIAKMYKSAPKLQKLQTLERVEQFVHMLSKHGCNEYQISKIMRAQPRLLTKSWERIVEPKIQAFKAFGFEQGDLARLLMAHLNTMTISLNNSLLPKMEFLKNVFRSQDLLVKALLKCPSVLCYSLEKVLKPSFAYWEGWGFREMELTKFLLINPIVLARTCLTPAQVDLIDKIGIDKQSKMFKYVLNVVTVSRMETLQAKMDNLQLYGISSKETSELFRVHPQIFLLSVDTVKKKMEFMVNNMGFSPDFIAKHPRLFHASLEKVIKPRFLVLQNMKFKNGLGVEHLNPKQLCTILKMPEEKFVRQIVEAHS